MKKVVVVGAGIAGLSAAIYAQRSGFDVTLCEQHSLVGGMCTSWRRKGYLFEGTINWLTGSNPKTEVYQMWKDTGALNDKVKVYLHETFRTIEWEGKNISIYRDIEKTAQQLHKLSPKDEQNIRRLVKDVKSFSHMQMPVIDIKGVKSQNPKRLSLGSVIKMLPAFPVANKLSKISCKDYIGRFKHPGVQKLLSFITDDHAATCLIASLATFDSGDGGYPEGGSLAMVDRMAETFKSLGGKLMLKTKVKRVVIESGSATGVMLENDILPADAVIVTQETIAALDRLFHTPLQDAWLKELRETTKSSVCTFISLGIRAVLPDILPVWKLEDPIYYAGKTVTEIGFNNYARYESYAPIGCSTLTTEFNDDTYDFWRIAKEEGCYEEEKRMLANQISQAIIKKYPQTEGNIEVIDIATPMTYERYTNAYHGSWMSVTRAGDRMKTYPGFLESVKGLYFAGHRIMPPGGLPTALVTGRRAAQMVCRQFDVMFR